MKVYLRIEKILIIYDITAETKLIKWAQINTIIFKLLKEVLLTSNIIQLYTALL